MIRNNLIRQKKTILIFFVFKHLFKRLKRPLLCKNRVRNFNSKLYKKIEGA